MLYVAAYVALRDTQVALRDTQVAPAATTTGHITINNSNSHTSILIALIKFFLCVRHLVL